MCTYVEKGGCDGVRAGTGKKKLRPRFLLLKSHTQASISCCSYKSLFVSNSFTPLALLAVQKSLPYFAAYLVFPKSHGTYLFSLVSKCQDCFVHAGSASILLNPINFTSLHSPVLDHTLDLLPHCQDYQYQPVYHQHGPKHGQIEDLTPTACKAQSHRSCRRVPEFELG